MTQTITQIDLTFIPDGYSCPGYIEAEPGIHGPLFVHYCPMNAMEVNGLSDAIEKSTQPHLEVATVISKRIKKWSAVTPDKQSVEISIQNTTRLPPRLFRPPVQPPVRHRLR